MPLVAFFETGVSTLIDLYREDVDKDRSSKEACNRFDTGLRDFRHRSLIRVCPGVGRVCIVVEPGCFSKDLSEEDAPR